MIFLTIFLVFPIFGAIYMIWRFDDLSQVGVKDKFGSIYEGYFVKNRVIIVYWIADNLRKTILCIAIVVLRKYFWAQMYVFFVA